MLYTRDHSATLLGSFDDLLLSCFLVDRRSVVLWWFGIYLFLSLCARLVGIGFFFVLVYALVRGLSTNLCHDNRNEAAQSHTDKICQRTSEDANENGDKDGEEATSKSHVQAMEAVVSVSHVVRTVVRVSRTEFVRWFALQTFLRHRVALVSVAALPD